MDKQTIVSEVNTFTFVNDYNPSDVIVTHGGALVLSGRRDTTRDIDLWVTRDIWVNEIRKGGKPKALGSGIWVMSVAHSVDIHIGWETPDDVVREHWSGCHFLSERTLLKEYLKLGRKKDHATIELLSRVVQIRDKYNLN